MFAKIALTVNRNNDAEMMPFYPMENIGIMKFVGVYLIGFVFLLLVVFQFILGMTNFTHSSKMNFFKKILAMIGAIGFITTLSFVAVESFGGKTLIIKDCSTPLM
jgi:hypothetical protein